MHTLFASRSMPVINRQLKIISALQKRFIARSELRHDGGKPRPELLSRDLQSGQQVLLRELLKLAIDGEISSVLGAHECSLLREIAERTTPLAFLYRLLMGLCIRY